MSDDFGICDCGLDMEEHGELEVGENCELWTLYVAGWKILEEIPDSLRSAGLSEIFWQEIGGEHFWSSPNRDLNAPHQRSVVLEEAEEIVTKAKVVQLGAVMADPESVCWHCGTLARDHVPGQMGTDCDFGKFTDRLDQLINSVSPSLLEMGLNEVNWTTDEATAVWSGGQPIRRKELGIGFKIKQPLFL